MGSGPPCICAQLVDSGAAPVSAHEPKVRYTALNVERMLAQNITVDPTDPQKFFQDNDNTFNVRPDHCADLPHSNLTPV